MLKTIHITWLSYGLQISDTVGQESKNGTNGEDPL